MATQYIENLTEAEWLELRVLDITSTETAALFGLSPYTTELELFYRKQTGEQGDFKVNSRMTAGQHLEPSIAQFAGHELGVEVRPFKCYATDDEIRMGSSFDYEILGPGELSGWILEVKNVDFLVYRDQWQDDEAPDHIEVQVQHQLELTGRPGAVIACLVGGNDLRLIKRERNEKMGLGIRQRIERFWKDVEADNPPDPNYMQDADFIISLHQSAGEEVRVVEDDDPVADLLRKYQEAKALSKQGEEQAKAAKAEILSLIGDDVSKVVAGRLSLSCGMTKETPPTLITEEMVGQTYGGRRGFRNFRLTEKKK